ncbi:MAG: hypothetical protein ACM34K_11725 [Bacillota bacterium]
MNKKAGIFLLVILLVIGPDFSSAQTILPQALKIDLLRLNETYRILDQYSSRLWPGWTGYDKVPFLIVYPNGLRMLIGHPAPPVGFVKVEGIILRNNNVFIDNRNLRDSLIEIPTAGGGGLSDLGSFKDRDVEVIKINSSPTSRDNKFANMFGKLYGIKNFQVGSESEEQILIFIHELFHSFQRSAIKMNWSNPRFNTDLNFSVFSELEGILLEKACYSQDINSAKEYLKEFLVSRRLKNNSIIQKEIFDLSSNEYIEGTATYIEVKTLEELKKNFTPDSQLISIDKNYKGFSHAAEMISNRLNWLSDIRQSLCFITQKPYPYGLFQALLLDKLFPSWREKMAPDGSFLDQMLSRLVKLTRKDKLRITDSIQSSEDYLSALERNYSLIKKRDSLYTDILTSKNRSIVINLKYLSTFSYPSDVKDFFQIGFMRIYPEGIGHYTINDFEFTSKGSQIVIPQMNFIKWIIKDKSAENYKLTFSRKDDSNVYYDAVIETEGFILKAPEVKISENPARIKITVLSDLNKKNL